MEVRKKRQQKKESVPLAGLVSRSIIIERKIRKSCCNAVGVDDGCEIRVGTSSSRSIACHAAVVMSFTGSSLQASQVMVNFGIFNSCMLSIS